MALNYILEDIRQLLLNMGYPASEVILQNVIADPNQYSSLQNAIFIMEDSSPVSMDANIITDFSIYVRRKTVKQGQIVSNNIYHKLHQKRGNIDEVSEGNAKINLIQALSRPIPYSASTTGAKLMEFATRYRVTYIDTDFETY